MLHSYLDETKCAECDRGMAVRWWKKVLNRIQVFKWWNKVLNVIKYLNNEAQGDETKGAEYDKGI